MRILPWPGHSAFMQAERKIWRDEDGAPLGYIKQHSRLRHVVIRNVGHMAPHDNPLVCQTMLIDWIEDTRSGPVSAAATPGIGAAATTDDAIATVT